MKICSDCGSNNGHWAGCFKMPAAHAAKLEGFGAVFKTHLPKNEATYDEVARDLTAGTIGCPEEGLRYRELPIEQRIIVMQLAQQRGIDESLDNIDSHLSHVAHWFELSKLYEP